MISEPLTTFKCSPYVGEIALTAPVETGLLPITSFPPLVNERTGLLVAELATLSDAPISRTSQPSRFKSAERVNGVPSNSKIGKPPAVNSVVLVGSGAPLSGST